MLFFLPSLRRGMSLRAAWNRAFKLKVEHDNRTAATPKP